MDEERQEDVVDSAETTTQELEDNSDSYEDTDSTGESESEETGESSQQHTADTTETPEQRTARIKRQVEREAKKQGVSVEEYLGLKGKKGSQDRKEDGNSQEIDEKWLRTDLKVEGIKSKKEQDVIIDYIREKALLGKEVDVETALKSMVIKEELANIRKSAATPTPSARTGNAGGEKTLQQYAEMMKKGRTKEVPIAKQREIRKKRLIKW